MGQGQSIDATGQPTKTFQDALDAAFGSWEDVLGAESLEAMSKYADHMCVHYAPEKGFSELNLRADGVDPSRFKDWNTTSVGNSAYMCLHGHPDYRNEYCQLLKQFVEWKGVTLKFEIPTLHA